MSKLACLAAALLLLAGSQAENKPNVKATMARLNKGPDSVRAQIEMGIKADDPDWPAIQKQTAEYQKGAASLDGTEPKKGDKDSYARLMKEYIDDARAVDEAAQKKDRVAALAAHEKLLKSCAGCHKTYR